MANPVHTAAIGAPKAWINSTAVALGILAFINLFNYLDRYLVSALVESLKHSELALTDTQAGSLMSGFLIVFAVIAPVFGALGDRMSRPRLIAFGVACWSIATALSGLAWNFTSLFIARASVGVGEAAYVTIGPSLLSDYFPRGQRGRVMAIFFCAIPVGSALGYVVGGLMDVHFGWRMAFFVAGVPGLVLALLCLGLHDPPRGSQDDDASSEGAELTVRAGSKPGGRRLFLSYGELLRNKPYVLTVAGYVAYTFALGGLAFWMPAFLERMRGIPREQATVSFGTIVVITGFLGTFAGGWLGDYCAKYSQRAYLWISAIATLIAAPFAWLALTAASQTVYLICMVIAQLMMFLSTGPINASIVNLVLPTQRASANALGVFTIHLLGDVPSPIIIGMLSDASSLAQAVKIVPVAILIAASIWAVGALAQPKGKSA
ncbi:MAG: MFS transporter [Steroidobacteraceae bacterium]|jgi:predicted MFS family arabinose efflux permease